MAKKPGATLLAAHRRPDTTWHGTAFVVEALVLLVFLAFALATFMQLFSAAHQRGVAEHELTQAVLLASNDAEQFAAAPQEGSTADTFDVNGVTYLVTRSVAPAPQEGGTLYRAEIIVETEGEQVYALNTARYVSNGAKGGDAA